jgi:hypothetical protein
MSIVHWVTRIWSIPRLPAMLHEHQNCGKLFDPVMVCSECGEPLAAKQVRASGPARASGRCFPEGGKVR